MRSYSPKARTFVGIKVPIGVRAGKLGPMGPAGAGGAPEITMKVGGYWGTRHVCCVSVRRALSTPPDTVRSQFFLSVSSSGKFRTFHVGMSPGAPLPG